MSIVLSWYTRLMTIDHAPAQAILGELARPISEMRYLLEHGYRRASVIRFVGDHHQLDVRRRNVLERVVFTHEEAERRRAHLVGVDEVRGRILVIDGYNVLISIECLHASEPLFLCDDGVIRDIAARRGLAMATVGQTLESLIEALVALEVNGAHIIFDRQISRSGELAGTCRRMMDRRRLRGGARTESCTDRALIEAAAHAVVCTSDRVIIDASTQVFDIIAHLAGALGAPSVARSS